MQEVFDLAVVLIILISVPILVFIVIKVIWPSKYDMKKEARDKIDKIILTKRATLEEINRAVTRLHFAHQMDRLDSATSTESIQKAIKNGWKPDMPVPLDLKNIFSSNLPDEDKRRIKLLEPIFKEAGGTEMVWYMDKQQ